jgi:hypothetical protein
MLDTVVEANPLPPSPTKQPPDYGSKAPISWADIKPHVEEWFTKDPKELDNGSELYELENCPFGSDHERNTAGFLTVFATTGNTVPRCHHARCQGKTFIDFIYNIAPELLDKLRKKNDIPYMHKNGGLCRVTWEKDDHDDKWVPKYIPLTNFITTITTKIIHDDGVELSDSYQLEIVFGEATTHQTVLADEFPAMR